MRINRHARLVVRILKRLRPAHEVLVAAAHALSVAAMMVVWPFMNLFLIFSDRIRRQKRRPPS